MDKRLLSGVIFSPRGGSAHVTRALARELLGRGWTVRLVAGSRSDLGGEADARIFYRGLDLRPVDFARALRQGDALRPGDSGEVTPMHPSFEQRPGAPDPVFAALDDLEFQHQVRAWSRELQRAGAAEADLLYLHHLTPLNEAAARIAPEVPMVGHLHGTELLMLEQIEQGPPLDWRFAAEWRSRLREWAERCVRLIVSPAGLDRASGLLGVEPERFVPLTNGFDPAIFYPRDVDRHRHWHRQLVERPTALAPDGSAIGYREEDLAPIRDGVVLLYVGRFTKVKRVSFLLEAFAEAKPRFRCPVALVIVGGHPGEWEGEHPAEAIRRLGLSEAFIAGWQPQQELPAFLCGADVVILPSDREQFGQTLVEGMACGRPGIAANVLGPSQILEDGETGWLFDPDDRGALAEALVEAVNDRSEGSRRGSRALEVARSRLSWPMVGRRLDRVLREAALPDPLPEAEPLIDG
jgi:glycosyltransferase involved in cell wall biosynthesis